MASSHALIYSSPSVQRAIRINILESARLQQTLRYIEQARVHQTRLTNRDIRLTSTSMGYIQSCSGHSLDGTYSQLEPGVNGDTEKPPCFMYGERIWNKRRKRLRRSTSALEMSTSDLDSNNSVAESAGPYAGQVKNRPFSVFGFRTSLHSDKEQNVAEKRESELHFPCRSGASTPRGRVIPYQAWEDDISEVTKKILSAQTRAQSGKHRSVYQSSVEVMSSQASRNVRGLLRKIRITATPVV